jgi:hypothetical protein
VLASGVLLKLLVDDEVGAEGVERLWLEAARRRFDVANPR